MLLKAKFCIILWARGTEPDNCDGINLRDIDPKMADRLVCLDQLHCRNKIYSTHPLENCAKSVDIQMTEARTFKANAISARLQRYHKFSGRQFEGL